MLLKNCFCHNNVHAGRTPYETSLDHLARLPSAKLPYLEVAEQVIQKVMILPGNTPKLVTVLSSHNMHATYLGQPIEIDFEGSDEAHQIEAEGWGFYGDNNRREHLPHGMQAGALKLSLERVAQECALPP